MLRSPGVPSPYRVRTGREIPSSFPRTLSTSRGESRRQVTARRSSRSSSGTLSCPSATAAAGIRQRETVQRQRTMKPLKHTLLAIMVVLVLASFLQMPPATAMSATSSVDARIRLDWEEGTRYGRPFIQGYVYNDSIRAASNVQVLVETLDASGAVIARDVRLVRGAVAVNDRTYFEVPIKTPGASYRVSVTGFAWTHDGGGGP